MRRRIAGASDGPPIAVTRGGSRACCSGECWESQSSSRESESRGPHDAAAVPVGGAVDVFGGGQAASTDAVVRIDPATGRATVAAHLDEPLSDLGAAVIASHVYLVGGYTGSRFASAMQRYLGRPHQRRRATAGRHSVRGRRRDRQHDLRRRGPDPVGRDERRLRDHALDRAGPPDRSAARAACLRGARRRPWIAAPDRWQIGRGHGDLADPPHRPGERKRLARRRAPATARGTGCGRTKPRRRRDRRRGQSRDLLDPQLSTWRAWMQRRCRDEYRLTRLLRGCGSAA